MTTNRIEVLDEALLRPGRSDYRLYLGKASDRQKVELYCRFFPEASEVEAREFVEASRSAETMAEFQGLLLGLEQREGRSDLVPADHGFWRRDFAGGAGKGYFGSGQRRYGILPRLRPCSLPRTSAINSRRKFPGEETAGSSPLKRFGMRGRFGGKVMAGFCQRPAQTTGFHERRPLWPD